MQTKALRIIEGDVQIAEDLELAEREIKIEAIQRSAFVDLGMELRYIRDKRLYKSGYKNFDDYCQKRWKFQRGFADKTIRACGVYEKLSPTGLILPIAETQVRPLVTLKSDEEQIEAWNMAVKSANGDPTEEDVKTAVKAIKEKKRQQEVAKPVNQTEPDPNTEQNPEPEQDNSTEDEDEAFRLESEDQVAEELQSESPALDLKPQYAGPAPAFITLDEWKNLDAEHVDYYLNGVPSTKSLNRQDNASIEWAQWTWNPITGCRHDCPYCYARDIANRYYQQKFEPSFIPDKLLAPGNTSVPEKAKEDMAFKNIFTCSMADLFGRWVPAEWIESVLFQVRANPQWNFLFLTKFPKRMSEFDYPKNAWLGTSVDCQARVKAAEDAFSKLGGGTKWLSVEPMLEPLKFKRLELFDWIVVGGASKSNQTPEWVPPIDWIVDLHQQARKAGCRIYYKTNCGMLDPLRIKEFPWQEPKPKELPQAFKYLGMR